MLGYFMKRPWRTKITFLLAALVLIALGGLVRLGMVLQLRRSIIAELQPIALKNCTLKRFGSAYDGGYLMCENLIEKLDAAYSYGVGRNDDWGCELSRRYQVPVHQYDCFDPARPTCDGGTFVFHNECVGSAAEQIEGRVFDTLSNQITRNGDRGKQLLVKIDIEGAEWDALLATPDDVLAAIPQLAMELHGTTDAKVLEGIRKLKQHFYVVNLHFNNWSCTPLAAPLPAWAYQVLFVNKRIGQPDSSVPVPAPMSALNAPDAPGEPDCQLDW
jgi:hypothetical protein